MDNLDILLGTLLGDSSLQTYTGGKTWRLRYISQNEEYIFHLYEVWRPYVSTGPRLSDDGYGNFRWYFNTRVIPELTQFVEETQIYKRIGHKWIKKVPINWSNFSNALSERALAYWYMDDGSKKNNAQAYYLCTDCFNLEQVKFLGSVFKDKWGIHVSYHKSRTNYRIYIPVEGSVKFKAMTEKYILQSFKYKL